MAGARRADSDKRAIGWETKSERETDARKEKPERRKREREKERVRNEAGRAR